MPITSRFITTTRDDLFRIGRIMAAALEPQLFYDKEDPVIVSILGSWGSGKSILAEPFRELVFGRDDAHAYRGDAVETGQVNGRAVEIGFFDSSFETSYNNDAFNRVAGQTREDMFLSQRDAGGITVIQNKLVPAGADIEFWVENTSGRINNDFPSRLENSGLKDAFNDAVALYGDKWVRYVEINVGDKLASTPAVKAAVKKAAFD